MTKLPFRSMRLAVLFAVAPAALLLACSQPFSESAPAAEAPTAEAPAAEAPAADAPAETAAAPEAAPAEGAAPAETAAAVPAPAAAPAAPAAAGVTLASYTGDATRGAGIFRQCATCHSLVEGQNRVGPYLKGIVGRPAGQVPGFRYSPANKNSGITWTEEQLFTYLENPQQVVKGTYMAYAGLKDPQQRADVIAYLKANP